MVIAFCRESRCRTELFVLEAHVDEQPPYALVELAKARLQMKACCLVSFQVSINALRSLSPDVDFRIIEPSREPNPN